MGGLGRETLRGILIFTIVLTIPCYLVGIGVYLLSPLNPEATSTPPPTFTLAPTSAATTEVAASVTPLPTEDNSFPTAVIITDTPTNQFNPILTVQQPPTQTPVQLPTLLPTATIPSPPTVTPTLTPTQPILLPASDTPAP